MADYYDPSNPDFATQEQQLLQAAARIKALRGTQAQTVGGPDAGWTSAVTGARMLGIQPKQNLLGAALPAISQGLANADESSMNQQRTALSAAEQQNLADWIGKAPQDTPYSATPLPGHTGGAGGDLVQANVTPAHEASDQDMTNYYAQGMKGSNPLVTDLAKKGLNEQMFEIPKEDRALKVTMAKLQAASQEKALDRRNKLDAASIKAKAEGAMNLEGTYDEHGVLTGALDRKGSGVYVMGPDGQLVRSTGVAGAGGATGPQKAPSPAQQKADADLRTKVEESNDALGMIAQAREKIKGATPNYGAGDTVMEGLRRVGGRPASPGDAASQALDTLAGQLASKYPRGPGSITDKERELFVQYMGDVNNRTIDPNIRLDKLQLVENMLRNSVANAQGARTGGGVTPKAGGFVTITGDADFDKLAPGTRFIGPDGNKYVK